MTVSEVITANKNYADKYDDKIDEETVVTSCSRDDDLLSQSSLNKEETVFLESVNNPSALIGWQIQVHEKGMGIVLGIKKSLGRATKFKVQFDSGETDFLSLKRSPTKGCTYFSPVKKM